MSEATLRSADDVLVEAYLPMARAMALRVVAICEPHEREVLTAWVNQASLEALADVLDPRPPADD